MSPPLPAWADQLGCELPCPRCGAPVRLTLPALATDAPAHCPCGHAWSPAAPPGLAQVLALLTQLERAAVAAGTLLPAKDRAATR